MTSRIWWLIPVCASLWAACDPAPQPPRSPSPAAAVAPAAAAAPTRAQRRALKAQAMAAYDRKDFAACARLFEQARDLYGAACCHAQAGATDAAFTALAGAIDGTGRVSSIDKDSDLDPLHGDPRWQRELDHLAARTAEHRKTLNA